MRSAIGCGFLALAAFAVADDPAPLGTLVGFTCISAWALFGVAIRGFLQDARRQRAFNLLMAATLLVLAGEFLR